MDRDEIAAHLSHMPTSWTALGRAHGEGGGEGDEAGARGALLERYRVPIYRYLLAATRDSHLADDLFQDFAVKLLRGDFRRADPNKGRFRDLLKSSLYRMVLNARARRRPLPRTADAPEPAADDPPAGDAAFQAIWREELFHRAWDALREEEQRTGRPAYTVLRFRTDHPELRSHEAAERLSADLGKAVSPEWVRKWLTQGRAAFARILVEDVVRSLGDPSADDLEEELLALDLRDPCREALDAYRRARGGR